MDKYIVKYTDKSGDLSTVWVAADSKDDAKNQVRSEYWDVQDIVMAYKE